MDAVCVVKDNLRSTPVTVLHVELSVTTVSVCFLCDCYEMSYTFSVWMVLLCSAIVWDVWKHYELWLTQRRLALQVSVIGSWCHSRMWSVSESERLLCTAKLLIRQQVIQVILLDLYLAYALLRMSWISFVHILDLSSLQCISSNTAKFIFINLQVMTPDIKMSSLNHNFFVWRLINLHTDSKINF